MRKFLLWIFLPFALITGALTFLIPMMQADPGYVLIAVGGKVIEMRFWLAALGFVVLFAGCWITVNVIKGTLRFALATVKWWPAKTQALLWERQERAMIALWEGDLREAHRHFAKIARSKSQHHDVLALINAANSATDLNLFTEADYFLNKAESLFDKNHRVPLLLSRARYHQKQGQDAKAQTLASQALSVSPLHPGALHLLLSSYQAQQDWPALQSLIPRLQKARILEAAHLTELQTQVDKGLLATATDLEAVHKRWADIPKNRRNALALTTFYIQQLLHLGADEEANPLLRKLLKNQFSDDLIDCFAKLNTDDAAAQLQYAERWLSQQPNNPVLLLCLGRIAIKGELWGKAKTYLEQSLAANASPAAYAELAKLNARLGDHQKSASLFQQGLLHSANSQPAKGLAVR